MKRCIFGAALLVALGLGCLWTGTALSRFIRPLCNQLALAREEALAQSWDDAADHALAAQRDWQGSWHALAAAADHTPLEDIDDLFAQLGIYGRLRQEDTFAALCAQLERRLEAVENAHSLRWWNFL